MAATERKAPARERFAVDASSDPARLEQRLAELVALVPSGHAERLAGFGFVLKREPDAFAGIGTGTTLGMGLMLAELSSRMVRVAPLLQVVAASCFALAGFLFSRFLHSALGGLEVEASGALVLVRRRFGSRVLSERAYHADDIVAVQVLRDGGGPGRVELCGPRHARIAVIFETRQLDPEAFATWLGESLSLVARRASLTRPSG